MAKYTIGIALLALGAIASDGGPGTSLTALGYTLEGSGQLNQDDPEKTDFFAEEVEAAVYSRVKAGAITLTFQVMNPDADTLVKLFGGTATASGSGANAIKTWNLPSGTTTIEQTVKITPQDGMTIIIPRGQVTAKLNGQLTRQNLFGIDVTVTALQPTKSGVGAVQFIEPTPA